MCDGFLQVSGSRGGDLREQLEQADQERHTVQVHAVHEAVRLGTTPGVAVSW